MFHTKTTKPPAEKTYMQRYNDRLAAEKRLEQRRAKTAK